MSEFKRVVIGGTFYKLHKGHRALIKKALEVGELIFIGLTTDEMAKKMIKGHSVGDFEERKRGLEIFLREMKALDRAQIFPINDPYGPTLVIEDLDAIVVSPETVKRAKEINLLRRKNGLKPLKIVVIRMVLAEDNLPISTARILSGEITEEGEKIQGQKQKTSP
ncbi:MAG: phosphopantetheine adenylyltransferase [Candidatus Bathyarchaeota archaeon]|nr:phosphopantetheine adenylyltransferase [Candidatus Bathyarchaeota archaeon]